jgi:lipopolysaccharide export LptBFGC system permease protein LptF
MGQVSQKRIQQLKKHTNKEGASKKQAPAQRARRVSNKTAAVRSKRPSQRPPVSRQPRPETPDTKKAKRSRPKARLDWHWRWTPPYLMIAFAFTVGSIAALLHGSDLLFGWPFHGLTCMFDGIATFCGITLAAMCVHTYREFRV